MDAAQVLQLLFPSAKNEALFAQVADERLVSKRRRHCPSAPESMPRVSAAHPRVYSFSEGPNSSTPAQAGGSLPERSGYSWSATGRAPASGISGGSSRCGTTVGRFSNALSERQAPA